MSSATGHRGSCSWPRGLYAIVDPAHLVGLSPIELAGNLLSIGCAVLQLRAKGLDDSALLELAMALNRMCKSAGVPFVVNDRPDIAVLVNADGVHLGQRDLSVVEARKIGRNLCIGVSTHTLEQARQAELDQADLIGFGPIFPTKTKENPDPVVGLEQLARVCSNVELPVVAIGGISTQNVARVWDQGPRWVAAISAVRDLAGVAPP